MWGPGAEFASQKEPWGHRSQRSPDYSLSGPRSWQHVSTSSFPVLDTYPYFLIKKLVEYFCISIYVVYLYFLWLLLYINTESWSHWDIQTQSRFRRIINNHDFLISKASIHSPPFHNLYDLIYFAGFPIAMRQPYKEIFVYISHRKKNL